MVDIVYASSGTAASGGMGSTLIMIVLMIAIFYFLLIRPENQAEKAGPEEMLQFPEEGRLADDHRRRVWPCRFRDGPHRRHRDERGPRASGVCEVRRRRRRYAR